MADLTVLFDGGCPLCLREVNTLKRLDGDRQRLAFVDIDDPNYSPDQHQGISYRQAMGRIHAIAGDGQIVTDVAVFRRLRIGGLGLAVCTHPLAAGWPCGGCPLRLVGRQALTTNAPPQPGSAL